MMHIGHSMMKSSCYKFWMTFELQQPIVLLCHFVLAYFKYKLSKTAIAKRTLGSVYMDIICCTFLVPHCDPSVASVSVS